MDASQTVMVSVQTLNNSETEQTQGKNMDAAPAAEGPPVLDALQTTKPKKPKGPPKAPPSAERPPGKSLLPLTRVQKILKADKELPSCNKEAVFLISVATEEFIKRLGEAGQQQAMREKRATVQRKDVATAVRRADEFVFLEEILSSGITVPPPALAKRKQKASGTAADSMNIEDAFGKKATADADVSLNDTEVSAHPSQNDRQGDGDAMDIS